MTPLAAPTVARKKEQTLKKIELTVEAGAHSRKVSDAYHGFVNPPQIVEDGK